MTGLIPFKNKRLLFRQLAAVTMIVLPRAAGPDSRWLLGAVMGILVVFVAVDTMAGGGLWRGKRKDEAESEAVVGKMEGNVARAESGDVGGEEGLGEKKGDSTSGELREGMRT